MVEIENPTQTVFKQKWNLLIGECEVQRQVQLQAQLVSGVQTLSLGPGVFFFFFTAGLFIYFKFYFIFFGHAIRLEGS